MSEPLPVAALPEDPSQVMVWELIKHLVNTWTDKLAGKQVVPFWPGDTLEARSVWMSSLEATEREVGGLVGDTRVSMYETWVAKWELEVHDAKDPDDAWTALQEMAGAMDAAVREDPRQGGFPGLVECLFDQQPFQFTLGLGVEGFEGYGQLALRIYTYLH